jgi:uncharacterized membrane protein
MRWLRAVPLLIVLVGCAAGAQVARPSASCTGPQPTYVADVRPVLEKRCFTCHAGSGPAAEEHDFTHVETLRAQRQQLVDDVTAHAMPPQGRPPLEDAEAQVLLRWAACDTAER